MSFTLDGFASKRPYLFHLTARENLGFLSNRLKLTPARLLFEEAGLTSRLREKRRHHVEIELEGYSLQIRDQAPLHEGNMKLHGGWKFADFIEHLNGRVFFWPGRKDGLPISYGRRHYERYIGESPVVLRVSTDQMFSSNAGLPPEFCRFNSGSPRWTYGNASPRGPETFLTCDRADFGISNVVEVTFPGVVTMPTRVEVGDTPDGPWRLL